MTQRFIKNKISVYQLEVIQDNEKALTLYKKQGFRINRILNCDLEFLYMMCMDEYPDAQQMRPGKR